MEVIQAIGATSVAELLRNSETAYILVNAAHIFAIGLLVGSIATLDLRLLGLFRAYPIQSFGGLLSRMAATGIVAAAVTGGLLFSTRPAAYLENPALMAKVTLIGCGVINAVILHRGRHWALAVATGEVRMAAKVSAAISLVIWAGAVLAGRWIGFLM
jgi:hypothetical protein